MRRCAGGLASQVFRVWECSQQCNQIVISQNVWHRALSIPCQSFEDEIVKQHGKCTSFVHSNLALQISPGRGRGLYATAPLQLGDTIMAVQPLAIIQGAVDEIPEAARLLPQLKERISGAAVKSESPVHQSVVAAWVGQLHKGGSATDQTALGRLQQLFLHPLDQPMPDAIIQADPLDSDVESAVDYNAFGDAYDDLAIASYQRASSNSSAVSSTSSKRSAEADVTDSGDVPSTATSHVGIWPHFSLLNHSCTPSCVHYVVGSTMVVRAVCDIPAGEELTVSYLGREELSPAQVRQKLLHDRYGFTCTCPRCQLEGRLDPALTELLREVHLDVKHRLSPDFTEAATHMDRVMLDKVGQSLVSWSSRLQPALEAQLTRFQQAGGGQAGVPAPHSSTELGALVSQLGGAEAALLHVHASVYDYLELLQQHSSIMEQLQAAEQNAGDQQQEGIDSKTPSKSSHATGGGAALLRLCADTLSAVSKGSELHVFLAVRLLELALQAEVTDVLGSDVAAVEEAQAAEEALVARYGRVSEDIMSSLAHLNLDLSRHYVV